MPTTQTMELAAIAPSVEHSSSTSSSSATTSSLTASGSVQHSSPSRKRPRDSLPPYTLPEIVNKKPANLDNIMPTITSTIQPPTTMTTTTPHHSIYINGLDGLNVNNAADVLLPLGNGTASSASDERTFSEIMLNESSQMNGNGGGASTSLSEDHMVSIQTFSTRSVAIHFIF